MSDMKKSKASLCLYYTVEWVDDLIKQQKQMPLKDALLKNYAKKKQQTEVSNE